MVVIDYKEELDNYLKELKETGGIHDFRIIDCGDGIFDIDVHVKPVVPAEMIVLEPLGGDLYEDGNSINN
jgi:hypothetical protein